MDERFLFSEDDDQRYKVITLLYYAYEGYRSCTEQLRDAIGTADEETIRYITDLQNEYRDVALRARNMLEG